MRFQTLWALTLGTLAFQGFCGETTELQSGLKTAEGSDVKYYLALPTGWTPKSTWPIVVTLDGAGHNFQGNHKGFIGARGKLPFILITPCVSSNGNDPADLKAVLAIVQEIQKPANGQPKFFVTGFSAGGHVMWQLVFMHPELLAGAASAAGNFRNRGIDGISKAPERVQLPIHEFLGEKDGIRVALSQQWQDALKLAHENGYENLTLTNVPEAQHQAFAGKVIEFFASLLPK